MLLLWGVSAVCGGIGVFSIHENTVYLSYVFFTFVGSMKFMYSIVGSMFQVHEMDNLLKSTTPLLSTGRSILIINMTIEMREISGEIECQQYPSINCTLGSLLHKGGMKLRIISYCGLLIFEQTKSRH